MTPLMFAHVCPGVLGLCVGGPGGQRGIPREARYISLSFYTCIYIYIYMHMCVYIYIYYVCVYVYIYIYIHNIYMYIYIYIYYIIGHIRQLV